ncbi:GMC family oxidoreductase [Phenylobacterium sp. 20VBR1]|uniref:GMC family oxidoreductase n=1 Tax=Phenylobacterium glaciei TaxID=2803784 RepID=A0A941CYW1_9CAUL|nr:GMC family oxidoreductase [Phenylobacterium glaciei]
MIIGWDDLAARTAPVDVVVVGGGAAGLTLAHALRGSGLSILLLEAGGLKQTKAGQSLFEGELADPAVHPWLHHFRVRAAGGASRIWGGRCLPYDPIDFELRPWVPGPGWPIALADLTKFYERAQIVAEAGPFDYDPATALPGRPTELAPGLDSDLIATRLERFSKPTDFWKRFSPDLTNAPDVQVLLNAPLTGVRLTLDGASVDHLEVRRPDGGSLAVRARRYVLAAGGLETVRLLLASDDVKPGGVGGDHGHLGRYYMSHLAATSGEITFATPQSVAFDYELDPAGIYVRRRLALTEKAQRRISGLNVIFRTHLRDPADPAHGDPVLSAMFLVKDMVLYEYSRKFRERRGKAGDRLRHIGNILRDPVKLAAFSRMWLQKRTFADRKLPSVVLGSRQGVYALEFHAEQAPNPDSRLTLSDQRDALGMRRLRADWRTTPLDIESLQRAYGLLSEELTRTGTGALRYNPAAVAQAALSEGAYGGHHLGAARMAANPKDGVVDPDCRVHGTPNLFIASSAVFPTSSQANPTLTILALSLRIADQLKLDLGSP